MPLELDPIFARPLAVAAQPAAPVVEALDARAPLAAPDPAVRFRAYRVT